VLAVPAVLLLAALFALPRGRLPAFRSDLFLVPSLLVLAAIGVGGIFLVRASPASETQERSLTVVTFNVQQGYSADNRRSLNDQLAFLRTLDADIVGLQESDLNRVAGGNDDLVRYFADHLNLYSYAGPKTVTGTFGIALLSRYPIEEPRTFYLFSEGEQTAVISAQVAIGGRTFHAFVTHLGNGGPLEQVNEVLSLTSGLNDVLLVGDFNFRPDTEQYRLTTRVLENAWAKRRPGREDGSGMAGSRPIDYVFLTSGTDVIDARYVDTRVSDHPALVVQIAW
jgi:endonuclease/exonuclease/phosphatase family metal-dependent hydrolase